MGVRILYGDNGESCLYDSATETVFGVLFHPDEDPQEFLDWLEPADARSFDNLTIQNKINEWRANQRA